jgi:hypothetical protein
LPNPCSLGLRFVRLLLISARGVASYLVIAVAAWLLRRWLLVVAAVGFKCCPRIAFRQHLVAVYADHARLACRLCHGSLAYPKTLGSLRFLPKRDCFCTSFFMFVCPHQNTLSALGIIYQIDSWDAHGADSYSRIGRLCVLLLHMCYRLSCKACCSEDQRLSYAKHDTISYTNRNALSLSRHRTIPGCPIRMR